MATIVSNEQEAQHFDTKTIYVHNKNNIQAYIPEDVSLHYINTTHAHADATKWNQNDAKLEPKKRGKIKLQYDITRDSKQKARIKTKAEKSCS